MRERDRLAALGEMAAGLAHEIRNPLGAIKGAAQCLDPETVPTDDREFIEVIVEEVNRLNGVVTAFLDYARPLKQSFGPTDVNEVVTRTLRLIQNDLPKNVTIREALAPDLARVDGDAEQLKQVLINLVQNAAQAIGDKPGEIVLDPTDQPALRRLPPARLHRDSGDRLRPGHSTGAAAEHLRAVLHDEAEGHRPGARDLLKRIVKSHGGTVAVQSKVGEGATFVIRLPSLPSEQPAPETPLPEGTPMPGTIAPPEAVQAKASRRDRKKKQRA